MDRKLVKQTVMTSVYGVTYTGARDQIKKRLKERNAISDDPQLYAAACYAAKVRKSNWIGVVCLYVVVMKDFINYFIA